MQKIKEATCSVVFPKPPPIFVKQRYGFSLTAESRGAEKRGGGQKKSSSRWNDEEV